MGICQPIHCGLLVIEKGECDEAIFVFHKASGIFRYFLLSLTIP